MLTFARDEKSRENYKLALSKLCYLKPEKYDKILDLMNDSMRAEWDMQLTILQVRGQAHNLLQPDEKKVVEEISKDMQQFEEDVHQMREVVLSRDPIILDEMQHQDKENLNFVRLEKYDHACHTAFLIKDYGEREITESNKLFQGFRMTFSQFNFKTQSDYRTFQKAICEPIALYLNSFCTDEFDAAGTDQGQ